jgi:hypothetical protein
LGLTIHIGFKEIYNVYNRKLRNAPHQKNASEENGEGSMYIRPPEGEFLTLSLPGTTPLPYPLPSPLLSPLPVSIGFSLLGNKCKEKNLCYCQETKIIRVKNHFDF